jgi:hypothetical protein
LTKVVILLGAGATVSDVATKPRKDRPPLDRKFFAEAKLTHSTVVGQIRRYVLDIYDRDILNEENDRLEAVMAQVYTDLFNPLLEDRALRAFRRLLKLFTRRLASTTNSIEATNKRLVYRLISSQLAKGVRPKDLTIVTFNQDIQAEKMLYLMSTVKRWHSMAAEIFSFPELYSLPASPKVTAPGNTIQLELFPRTADEPDCIRLLKLHGSLNWYSSHSSSEPSRTAMFKPSRKISITRRRFIEPGMTLQSTQRQMYTLPVVVPPVTHKSAVLHNDMADLWRRAERRLRAADELVIFGYSCPALDFESSNQLRRSQVGREDRARLCVIDPASSVAEHYISLLEAKCLHYYRNGHEYLSRAD